MAAAKCSEAIHILWEILTLVAQGQIEKETLKEWMTRSCMHLQEVTALSERKRVSEGMKNAAATHLTLILCNLKLCMDQQTQSHINAAGGGPLEQQQEPQVEQLHLPLQQEQHQNQIKSEESQYQTEQQLHQQQQQQEEENINQNMLVKVENNYTVTSSVPDTCPEILIEIDAATSTTSTPTVSPTKSKRELSTNGITTTPNKSTVTPPAKRLKVDSTTEEDSNNNECDRSTIEETNGSPYKILYGLPKKCFYELEDKHMYQITTLRKVKTPFGPSVVAHLDDKIQMFLPKHLSQSLLDNRNSFENTKQSIIKKELYFVNDKGLCFFLNKSM